MSANTREFDTNRLADDDRLFDEVAPRPALAHTHTRLPVGASSHPPAGASALHADSPASTADDRQAPAGLDFQAAGPTAPPLRPTGAPIPVLGPQGPSSPPTTGPPAGTGPTGPGPAGTGGLSPNTGVGAQAYRPPVGPAASNTTAAIPARRGRSSLAVAAAAFVLGGAVGAGGFALGASLDNSQNSAGSVVTVSAPSTLDGSNPEPAASSPPVLSERSSAEPAAAVAQLIGPSVVQVETDRGQGSGVVYADGLLLTNHHVIEGARTVRVRTSDGLVIPVEVLGSDARNDIAVLSAPDADLPVAAIGSSADLEPGQLTVAIGSPFQLQQTVTAGIVSSTNRPVPNSSGSYTAMIQTDAPINPGNSGGALANRDGELVGINASIRTDGTSNSNVGIGFAVPIDTALAVAQRIEAQQSLEPGVLGVRGQGQDDAVGVPIAEVTPGSAAEAAGIQTGDRVLTIDGAPVTNIEELVGLVQSRFAGDTVNLEIIRGGNTITVQAVLT